MLIKDRIRFYKRIYKIFGLKAVMFLLKFNLLERNSDAIHLSGINTPIYLSNRGVDVTTLLQIFFGLEYKIPFKTSPKFIIDCGANIGLASVYFANTFPDAKIIAVEPEKNNFAYLLKNTSSYKNIKCLNQAIWSSDVPMQVKDVGEGSWGFQTVVAENDSEDFVLGITIDEILAKEHQDKICLLKVDIEGAEKELFAANYDSWLSKTSVLAIELHDKPGNNVSDVFFKAINNYKYSKMGIGENSIYSFYV